MSKISAADTVAIQKLLLRMAAAVASEEPLPLLPGETTESVNATIVAALNVISRATRLDSVTEAARPIADRLLLEPDLDVPLASQLTQLVAALNALAAHDEREPDYTIRT
jgi:hypothetical protein